MITSKNGIITWKRAGAHDGPVRAIAGGDFTRPGRLADRQLMRSLRACADALSVGAQTLRDQPDLIGAADDIGGRGVLAHGNGQQAGFILRRSEMVAGAEFTPRLSLDMCVAR